MTSVKCPKCNLVAFATSDQCKRCGASLTAAQTPPPRAPASAPAPASATGPWRDRRWLVKRMDVPLADCCIKCGESADILRKPVFLKVSSAWSLLTIWLRVHIYYPINLEVPLCGRHRAALNKIFVGLLVTGFALCAVGFLGMRLDSSVPVIVLGVGIVVVLVAILYGVRNEVVSVWKYKDPYLWLNGAHRSYLEQLPDWQR